MSLVGKAQLVLGKVLKECTQKRDYSKAIEFYSNVCKKLDLQEYDAISFFNTIEREIYLNLYNKKIVEQYKSFLYFGIKKFDNVKFILDKHSHLANLYYTHIKAKTEKQKQENLLIALRYYIECERLARLSGSVYSYKSFIMCIYMKLDLDKITNLKEEALSFFRNYKGYDMSLMLKKYHFCKRYDFYTTFEVVKQFACNSNIWKHLSSAHKREIKSFIKRH